jgi:membrane protein YdbS with pleckstrin-like domain
MIVEGKSYTVGMKVFIFQLIIRLLPGLGIFVLLFLVWAALPFLGPLLESLNPDAPPVTTDFSDATGWIMALGTFLFFCYAGIVIIYTWLEYITFTYKLSVNGLEIGQGILHREESSLPFRQIQNIEVKRSLLFRFIGLSRLLIFTAGNDDPNTPPIEGEVTIPILEKHVAAELRHMLLERAHTQRVQNVEHLYGQLPK